MRLRNNENLQPLDLAAVKGHTALVRYLEGQSCDLRCMCRKVIREAMGSRCYKRLRELPFPPTLRLFVNYGIPHYGWKAILIPPAPWTTDELYSGKATTSELREFILGNGSAEFIEDHQDTLIDPAADGQKSCGATTTERELEGLIDAFQTMYVWEAFDKEVEFKDQTAREPRYSMEKIKKREEAQDGLCFSYL